MTTPKRREPRTYAEIDDYIASLSNRELADMAVEPARAQQRRRDQEAAQLVGVPGERDPSEFAPTPAGLGISR